MSSLKVTLVQADGVERVLENVASGRTLMEVTKDSGVAGILGDCGGGCMCATCHVYVEAQWRELVGPPNEVENELLDMTSKVRPEASRLSCQIVLREELDGLKVVVAPM
jgi:2Fe-2S ferredoxin